MALNKVAKETSLVIEVQNGVDEAGDPKYSKKTLNDIKNDADLQNIYDVAEAVKGVLAAATRNTFLDVTSSIVNNK